jgi:hypothetical protein
MSSWMDAPPLELKVLGLASYIQLLSLRRAAKTLSQIHRASETAVLVMGLIHRVQG